MPVPPLDALPHRESHRDLLAANLTFGPLREIDGIVVSAGKARRNLRPAIRLARDLRTLLVVMRSGAGPTEQTVLRLAAEEGLQRVAVMDIAERLQHPLLQFRTSTAPHAVAGRLGPLSIKRNLGLVFGRMLGWRTMMLLDDDIHRLTEAAVLRAARPLDDLVAVGLAVEHFADHSVVCHANRLSGRPQQVFVSGSALVLDPARCTGFFPKIYNEDWLFLTPALRENLVGLVGTVRQRPYPPFPDPGRARVEEFGEVVGEGVVDSVRRGRLSDELRWPTFWADFLRRRQSFIRRAEYGVADLSLDNRHRAAALASLGVAQEALAKITADQCADYYRSWCLDLATWQSRLADLPRAPSLDAAWDALGLSGTLADLVA